MLERVRGGELVGFYKEGWHVYLSVELLADLQSSQRKGV